MRVADDVAAGQGSTNPKENCREKSAELQQFEAQTLWSSAFSMLREPGDALQLHEQDDPSELNCKRKATLVTTETWPLRKGWDLNGAYRSQARSEVSSLSLRMSKKSAEGPVREAITKRQNAQKAWVQSTRVSRCSVRENRAVSILP